MGKLIGNAVTLDGDMIRVTFEGEGVADGILAHIVSINTQMDGGGEYSPLKITTASVSCLVDGAELMRLCVSEQPVSVIIENVEQESILFKGYVVPNSYNQALSGVNDTITIECVDGLGYAKYLNYERGETFSVMTLADVFSGVATVLGINDVRIANDVSLVGYDGTTSARYDLLRVSDNIFYNEINPEDIDGELLYEPVAMTYKDVLSMIAESLRMTWVQVGDVLYLIDDIKIYKEKGVVYRLTNGLQAQDGATIDIDEEAFAATLCNVSSLPRCSRVVINHEESGERAIQPALFEYEHLRQDGEVREEEVTDDNGEVTERVICQALVSRTYDVLSDNHAMIVGFKKFDAEVPTSNETYNDSWETCVRITPDPVTPTAIPVVSCRRQYCGAVTPTAGRGIRVYIEQQMSHTDDRWWPHNTYDFANANGLLFGDFRLEIKSTNATGEVRYFQAYDATWVDTRIENIIYFADESTYYFARSSSTAAAGLLSDNVIPVVWSGNGDGVIEVTLLVRGGKNAWWRSIYIKKFDVVEAESRIWSREYPNPTSKKEARGQWKLNEVQEVSPPIDNYYYMTERGFGNVIDGVVYNEILVGGEHLIDRVWSQANLGDRLMWEMALRDESNALSPLDAFTCSELWSGRKIMAGYVKDIINNQITATLI